MQIRIVVSDDFDRQVADRRLNSFLDASVEVGKLEREYKDYAEEQCIPYD